MCLPGGVRPILGRGLDVAVHERAAAGMTALAVVPGGLQVLDRGVDDDAAGVLRADSGPRHGGEVGQLAESHQHLDHRAFDLDAFHTVRKRGREVRLADHAEEGAGGIGVGEDDVGHVAAAVDGAHARRRPVLDLDLGDFAVGGDLDPVLAVEGRDRFGDTAHAAAHEAPGALVAADATDEVVILHIRGAGGHRTGVDPDHPAGARAAP